MAAAPQPTAAAPEAPPSAQVVGNAFVQQYYLVLHQSPDLVYRFYQDASRLARPSADVGAGGMDSVTTMEAISEKIMEMDVAKAEIRTVDSQESLGGGVTVLVTGHLTGRDGVRREFSQSFFLAPQEKGYFVLNDMFRFVGDGPAPAAVDVPAEADVVSRPLVAPLANGTAGPAVEAAAPKHDAALQQEQHVVEQAPPQPEEEEEVYNPPVEEAVDEESVPEVINEVPNNVAPVTTTTAAPVSQEEVPKKSYASIVKVMKEVPLAAPAPPARPALPKPEKQAPAPAPASAPVTDVPPFSSNSENSNAQEPEVDAHAIYVRNLPLNATETQLEDEFKKFGTIKQNGIQVRSNKIQGFCYGFVEFEDATAVHSAIEASPVTIGGRQCYIEEKRTPGSRGSSRGGGRFAPGRGNNFRNEGMRGRGNYSGGRGYGRGEFSYRSDYGGRGGGRGGSGRGADVGYQRVDHAGYASGRGGRTPAAASAPAK